MTLRTTLLAGAAALALPLALCAQPTAHYVPGVEGIKAASLPPPGVYLRDYNVFYFADQANDSNGDKIGAVDVDAFIYANVPRLVWITDKQVLGGFLGVDALLPLQYTSIEMHTPIGDFETTNLAPVTSSSRHLSKHADATTRPSRTGSGLRRGIPR